MSEQTQPANPDERPPKSVINKWIWSFQDFTERMAVARRQIRAMAIEGIPVERAVPLTLSHFVGQPTKMPYPMEHEVFQDVQHALAENYFDAHNFGNRGQSRHRDDA